MIETLQTWVMNFDFTSWMGFGLYWVPASICACGYTLRTWANYQTDIKDKDRDEAEKDAESTNHRVKFYSPTDTLGALIGRGLVTVLPVSSCRAASFDVAPRLFSSLFTAIGKVFDQPLVPKRKQN
jgi:hypothetical protein